LCCKYFFTQTIIIIMNVQLTRLLTLLLLLWGSLGMAQVDTSFWFAAPKQGSNLDQPVYIRAATFSKPSVITISMPSNPTFTPLVQTVAANSVYTFDMTPYLAAIVHAQTDTVVNKALKITATTKISAYYEVGHPGNPDLFALKGGNAMGTFFVLPSFKRNYGMYSDAGPQFLIVGTEDGTTVTITPSVDLAGHTVG
jgi:hypothetical protein